MTVLAAGADPVSSWPISKVTDGDLERRRRLTTKWLVHGCHPPFISEVDRDPPQKCEVHTRHARGTRKAAVPQRHGGWQALRQCGDCPLSVPGFGFDAAVIVDTWPGKDDHLEPRRPIHCAFLLPRTPDPDGGMHSIDERATILRGSSSAEVPGGGVHKRVAARLPVGSRWREVFASVAVTPTGRSTASTGSMKPCL